MPKKRRNAGPGSYRQSKKRLKKSTGEKRLRKHDVQWHLIASGKVPSRKRAARRAARYGNPAGATLRGWVRAKAVKIVRNKRGQAVKALIKT